MACCTTRRASVTVKRAAALLAVMLWCIVEVGSPSFSAEMGLGVRWPGTRNFLAGVVPAKQGLYVKNDTIYYSASVPRAVSNGVQVDNLSVKAVLDIFQLSYVSKWKPWGANHAFVFSQPLVWAELGANVGSAHVTGNRFGPGDPILSPIRLGWKDDKLNYDVNLAIYVPNGDYDIDRVVNTSLNYFTFDPEFAVTYLDPETGWDLSGTIGYLFNTQNKATHYTSGQALHMDFSMARAQRNGAKLGITGYMWLQVTPDSGSGALLGSYESRIFGLGPAIQWKTDPNTSVMLKYIPEFWGRDRLEGYQAALTVRAAF